MQRTRSARRVDVVSGGRRRGSIARYGRADGQALGLLAQIGIPIGGLGQQTSGTSTTTKNPSILEQLTGWKNLLWK